ncbi:bacteriophage Gp15 family protein [Carnobacterium divergens]|uniref:bacteriophage Gp15 family protein n=1 Tax=Carnobacterium divergens TaxID=2748 RepID=UPI0028925ABA|nr:bacteriophage Gp15 family protein [Carnobacterium divergens]MDT1995690.1 bacteriophage Gp15 family protein [Carnobacterium divergens]
MFSLAYRFNDSIEIQGVQHGIDMSFDNVLRVIEMLDDEDIQPIRKVTMGLEMLLDKKLECDLQTQVDIFNEIIETKVYTSEKEKIALDRNGDPMPVVKEENKQVYSIKHDAEYIFSSFKQAYDIDLIEEQGKLHWDKFRAYLIGLPTDTKFQQVMDIRQREMPKGKGSEKERKELKKLKELYALPSQNLEEGE